LKHKREREGGDQEDRERVESDRRDTESRESRKRGESESRPRETRERQRVIRVHTRDHYTLSQTHTHTSEEHFGLKSILETKMLFI
jgi:hypothetical protein